MRKEQLSYDHLLARTEIETLCYRYCEAIDGDDASAFGECFTVDGTWESRTLGRRVGRAQIAEIISLLADRPAENRPFHQTTGLIVTSLDADAGRSLGRARWLASYARAGTTSFGEYEDSYARDADGVWRFSSRRVVHRSERSVSLPG